jgi:multidrug transporter EmrE-like cation transporter
MPRRGKSFFSDFKQTRLSCFYLVACAVVSALAVNVLVFVLPHVNLTVLYTFDNSGVMLLSVFASWLFLGEKLSLLNIAGCITMCAGLVAVTLV